MSVQQMALVWELKLPHNQAWVLMAYADHADQDGEHVHPSIGKIAWKTGYSERQVQRIIRDLEAKGLMESVRGHLGGRNVFPLYRLTLEKGVKKSPFLRGDKSKRVTFCRENEEKGDISDTERVTFPTPKSLESPIYSDTSASQPSVKREPSVNTNHQRVSVRTREKHVPSTPPKSEGKHLLPESYDISPNMQAWFTDNTPGLSPQEMLDRMRDWAKSKRIMRSDWDAQLRNIARDEHIKRLPHHNGQVSHAPTKPSCGIHACTRPPVGQFCEYHGS